jgi:hypothetical protein
VCCVDAERPSGTSPLCGATTGTMQRCILFGGSSSKAGPVNKVLQSGRTVKKVHPRWRRGIIGNMDKMNRFCCSLEELKAFAAGGGKPQPAPTTPRNAPQSAGPRTTKHVPHRAPRPTGSAKCTTTQVHLLKNPLGLTKGHGVPTSNTTSTAAQGAHYTGKTGCPADGPEPRPQRRDALGGGGTASTERRAPDEGSAGSEEERTNASPRTS